MFTLIMKKHCGCFRISFMIKTKTKINSSGSIKKRETNVRRQTIIFMTCFLNLGLTWITGYLLIIPIDNEYIRTSIAFLFCLFNSMQGFYLFIVYVLVSRSRKKYFKHSSQEKSKQMKLLASSVESNAKKSDDIFVNNQSNSTEIYYIDNYSRL